MILNLRNGAEKVIVPQLAFVRVGEAVADRVREETQRFEDDWILQEYHLCPVWRVDMFGHQIFKDHENLDEEVEQVGSGGKVAQVIAVVVRRHLPEDGQHDGDERADGRIFAVDWNDGLDDGA